MFLSATMSTWDSGRKLLTPAPSPMSTFLGQKRCLLALEPSSFQPWRIHNIWHFWNIMTHGHLLSKAQTEQKYQVAIHGFQYLQIQHLFIFYFKHSPQQRPLSSFRMMGHETRECMNGFSVRTCGNSRCSCF